MSDRNGGPEQEEDVPFIHRMPLRRRWIRRRREAERYVDSGSPGFRPGDDNVVWTRRQPFWRPWWRRTIAGVVALVLLVVAAGAVFVITQRNVTTEVPLDAVVARFEAVRPPVTAEAEAQRRVDRDFVASIDAEPSVVAPDGPASAESEPVDSVERAPYVLPTEGVYSYRTSGGESISTFDSKHEYPDRTYSTIRHLGGCRWEQRNDVIEEHVDIRTMCGRSGQLMQIAQSREVEFYGQREGGKYVCDPPLTMHRTKDKPGTKSRSSCESMEGDKSVANLTFMGTERMRVGDVTIEAIHARTDSTFDGSATGTAQDELWWTPDTGLVLRWDRTVDSIAQAFGTKVRYEEDASFVLESLTPRG